LEQLQICRVDEDPATAAAGGFAEEPGLLQTRERGVHRGRGERELVGRHPSGQRDAPRRELLHS
jgi:hypothetical protein